MQGRVALAESVSAANSALLKRGDLAAMRGSLDFIVERNQDLNAIELERLSDKSRVYFGFADDAELQARYTDSSASHDGLSTTLVGGSIVSVPLLRGDQEWGQMHFQFAVPKSLSWWDKLRESAFSLMAFIGLVSFPMFYFYLGKMLKELNPSTAVPARVRSALDTIAESLLVLDQRGNVVLANAAFAELNGADAEDMLGTRADSLPWVQDDTDNPNYPWQQAFKTGEPTRMDMVGYVDKSGEKRKFIVNCSPVMGAKGKVGGVLVSMDDVTLLEEKELLLRESMEEAEAANEAKTAFLSNMSHEIRTPMTAILGFTEVLKRGLPPSDQDRLKHLNTISNSGTHLLELINDVLDLSKVESGAMEVEFIPCKAAFISHEVAHVLKVKAQEKGIDLTVEVENALPAHIISDPSRLRQIVTNLVGNAIKFTETGGVTVKLEHQDDVSDPRLLIKVIDSGIGMSARQLETIFDAFIQADASITRRFGGTGLGLSISRKLALAMNGDIIVTSEEGKGSTFMLTLPTGDINDVPMLSVEEVIASFSEVETVTAKKWTFPPSKALVVDDGPENRELLRVVLEELAIDIETAENGKVGLDAATAVESAFDVILMDIQMPVMDGYEAVEAMRNSGITLPIVALTANAMKGYEQKVLDAGFSHYMTKPINLDHLTALLAELLGGTCEELTEEDLQARFTHSENANGVTENDKAEVGSSGFIYSSMVDVNPKFESIAKQFVVRLEDQCQEMRACLDSGEFDALAKLAHWLKGSGGTVGFADFAEPAKALELAAKQNDADSANTHLRAIDELRQSIRFREPGSDESGQVENVTALAEHDQANENNHAADLPDGVVADIDNNGISDNPVFSSLPMDNPRFRGIVERFLPKLDEQLDVLHQAVVAANLDEVAVIAHWLKGSGGNVGFDGFTELAANLEASAKAGDNAMVQSDMNNVMHYANRVKAGWEQIDAVQKSA